MPTVKLIPSSYYISSSYLTVTDVTNMYADTSSTNYGTITNTRASTSYYYFYLRGFNIGDIPANAQARRPKPPGGIKHTLLQFPDIVNDGLPGHGSQAAADTRGAGQGHTHSQHD